MLARILAARRRPPVTSAQSLTRFLRENAALVAQKTVIGYCNARTSLPLSELMRDKPFADAFERGRAMAYIAVLADMFVIAEGRLRPAAAGRLDRLADMLAAQFDVAVGDAGVAVDPETRSEARDRLQARLRAAQSEAPQSIADVARVSGQTVYGAMPIHERFRQLDRESIIASVRFLMVGLANEFDRRLDAPRIVADLFGQGASLPAPA